PAAGSGGSFDGSEAPLYVVLLQQRDYGIAEPDKCPPPSRRSCGLQGSRTGRMSRCLDPATVVAGFFCFLVRQEGDPVGSDSETKVGAALRLAPLRRSGPSSGGPGSPAPGAGPRITDAGTGSDICCAMQF